MLREGGDLGGRLGLRPGGFGEVEAEGEENAVEGGGAHARGAGVEGGEDDAERVRGVEVVVERGEGGREGIGGAVGLERGAVGAELREGLLGGVQRIEGEVELLARVAGEEGVAEGGGAVAHLAELV